MSVSKIRIKKKDSIKNPSTLDNSFSPRQIFAYPLSKVEFNGNCLKQDIVSFPYKIVVNLYIAYELDTWPKKINTDFTLVHCLSGAVKLTKNTDPGKYEYGGYGIGFNAC